MAEKEKDFFTASAEVRLTSNGFIVFPSRDERYGGGCFDWSQAYVFTTAADMATWLRKRYAGHG